MPDWFVNLAFVLVAVFVALFLLGIFIGICAVGKIALDDYKEEKKSKRRQSK